MLFLIVKNHKLFMIINYFCDIIYNNMINIHNKYSILCVTY